MTICGQGLLCNRRPGSEWCAQCGWNPEEIERRKAAIRNGEMVRGTDGLKRLIVKRTWPTTPDVENIPQETTVQTEPESAVEQTAPELAVDELEETTSVFLCRPCMESNGAKMIRGNNNKGTCAICGKRRYGYLCEVKK